MCAYCEACLMMGRSRECELFVTGVYTPSNAMGELFCDQAQINRSHNISTGKAWGLSPAQEAAAAQALHFIDLKLKQRSVTDASGVVFMSGEQPHPYPERVYSQNQQQIVPAQRLVQEQLPKHLVRLLEKEQLLEPSAHGLSQDQLPKHLVRLLEKEQLLEPSVHGLPQNQLLKPPVRRMSQEQLPDPVRHLGQDQLLKESTSSSFTQHLQPCSLISRFTQKLFSSLLPNREEWAHYFLLWAVTGAGKTEMIFPLVEKVLARGGRVLIASPRRDVVIELDPRLRKAFPGASVVTLYGGSEQRWERGSITLSTTHQLFRFHQSFDLVVIDELDAFPYHGDPMLHYAAGKCGLPGGPTVLLSATPPREMQAAAKSGRLAHARVPVRFHRHPLPVPRLVASPSVAAMLAGRKAPPVLLKALRESIQRGAQCFVFVQRISQTEGVAALLAKALPCRHVAATSSQDPERAEKVKRFRACDDIRVLVTTTILERGVTIPRSDVYILDADGRLFDEASLVQMAGRAGRSADDPFGKVTFFAKERNESQLRAVKHIADMNKAARRQGYLR
jgi:late competence protein required for DNA uptake (superfamily II DNA/RNA helicase)